MYANRVLSTAHVYLSQPPLISPFAPKGPFVLATKLIKSYFEYGLVKEARILFDEIPERDVVTWTAIISGYTSCNYHFAAWGMFCEMVSNEVHPNAYTISSILKACKEMKALSSGTVVHGLAIKHGVEGSLYVNNALLNMYAACCATMDNARAIFQNSPAKNAASWTSLIAGYTHQGDGYRALQVFRQMLLEDLEANPFFFSVAVRACSSISSYAYGTQLHAAITKHGLESDVPVMNSVVDMYCSCNFLSDATRCFQEMTQKDLITWNTLIAGYEKSDAIKSLQLFSLMISEGCVPNCFTFTSVTAACANLVALSYGQQVHGGILCRGLNNDLALANALIDMYAKCGNIADSYKIFSQMSCRDLVSWTSMMIGYGAHGYGKEAVELFEKMVQLGIQPDRIVFVGVLTACSHAGLVDEGLGYFKQMVVDYNITPNQETYGCVVDLFGRAGRVDEAYRLIEAMPFSPDESVWGALLGACKAHKLPNLGKLVARRVLKMRPNMVGTYVALSNFYAAEGKWREFAKTRKLMKGMGNKKEAGRSWIELKDQVYSFVVGDKMGHRIEWVYEILDLVVWHMMKEAGYVPDFDCLLHDEEDGTQSEEFQITERRKRWMD